MISNGLHIGFSIPCSHSLSSHSLKSLSCKLIYCCSKLDCVYVYCAFLGIITSLQLINLLLLFYIRHCVCTVHFLETIKVSLSTEMKNSSSVTLNIGIHMWAGKFQLLWMINTYINYKKKRAIAASQTVP